MTEDETIDRIANPSGRVVIHGVRPSTTPIAEDEFVIAINEPRHLSRFDVLFQLHGLGHLVDRHGREFVDFLASIPKLGEPGGKVVLMPETHAEIPAALAFPICYFRSRYRPEFFTGSFPYAIAWALDALQGTTKIRIDGIDFVAGEQWAVPAIMFFLGIARERHVEVEVPPHAGLFDPGPWGVRYGFEGTGSEREPSVVVHAATCPSCGDEKCLGPVYCSDPNE